MKPDDALAFGNRAAELIALADGFEAAHPDVARRVRAFAREALDLLGSWEDELTGRVAMQKNYERAMEVISSRGYHEFLLGQTVAGQAKVYDHEADDGNPLL